MFMCFQLMPGTFDSQVCSHNSNKFILSQECNIETYSFLTFHKKIAKSSFVKLVFIYLFFVTVLQNHSENFLVYTVYWFLSV
mgnify:CR=1 FL=1